MKHYIVTMFFMTLVCQVAFGQHHKLTDEELNKSTVIKIRFVNTYTEVDSLAINDIENKRIFLFLSSGISPVVHANDEIFENKYDVYFHNFGCVTPDKKIVQRYNKKVFNHLTKLYGTKWAREIRKDIIGLSEWKKSINL